MCGIAGIYNLDGSAIEINNLKRFTDSMLHRGPDASGYELFQDNSLGLGQRRLSILDLSDSGKQPMSYANGRYWITYNGEVFNFEQIKSELIQKGYTFASETDTEVILASYTHWGKDCLNKFNGMWAFAIWDNSEQELFLARDRFGIKPLYYLFEPEKRFVFASETRAFKYLNSFNRQIDNSLLDMNIKDPYALEGLGYTIFNNILQVLPGHYMVIKPKQKVQQKRWWHIADHLVKVPKTIEEQTEKFYEIFRDACKIRLISDVPFATALSGGLDSTAVYSTVYDIMQKETLNRVNKESQSAFTAVFPGMPQDERMYAQIAADYTGGPITFLETENSGLAELVEKETELCDFINVSPISSISSVYKGMRANGIVVSLDGHGVDEMLYGYRDMVYSLYNNALWNENTETSENYCRVLMSMYHPDQQKVIIAKFDKLLAEKNTRDNSLVNKIKKYLRTAPVNSEYLVEQLPNLSDKPYDFSGFPLDKRMVLNEFFQHTLPALLRNFDRAGMMNSVEIRMPFMDWRLVSYVFSLPTESKIGGGFTKRIVREAMKGRMEESLRTRTYKVGIGSPVEYGFNGNLKEWAMDVLKDNKLRNRAENVLEKDGKWSTSLVKELWLSINTELIK
jgi:asparagine synthase (glutamine-hydrolysing)